jgi:flagellar hook-length control protein FliK
MAMKRAVTSLETLVSGLVPLSKGDALKTLNAANSKDDSKSELSEEELAGLSALMDAAAPADHRLAAQ